MKLHRLLLAAALTLLTPLLLWSQTGPQYTVQTQSIEEIASIARQLAQNSLPKEFANEFEKRALVFLDAKLFPGIDAKRPFGAYATLAPAFMESITKGLPDVKDSSLVLMIPISSEKDFVDLIGRTGLAAEKQADGSYTMAIPKMPFGIFLRAEKDYMYVSVANEAPLKKLLPAKEVIDAKETALLVIRQHHENYTKEAREANAKYMKSMSEMMTKLQGNLGVSELAILGAYFSMVSRWNESIDAGGKLSVSRIGADVKAGELYAEWTIVPKAKSKLAEEFEAMKPTRNAFAGLTENAVGHAAFSPPLDTPEIRDMMLAALAKWKESVGQRNLSAEETAAQLESIKALQRTIKSGNMDMAAAWRGPNASGLYTMVGAIRIDDPTAAAKAMRALFEKKEQGKGKWDAHTIGAMTVHEISVPLDNQAKIYFGAEAKLLVGVGPNVVCAAMGGDALALLKQVQEGKDGPAPLLSVEANGRRLAETLKKFEGYQGNAMQQEFVGTLGKMERVPILGFRVEGGKQFTGRMSLGLAGIVMLVPRAQAQNKEDKAPLKR